MGKFFDSDILLMKHGRIRSDELYYVYLIFTPAKYEMKVVLLHLWRVDVKTVPGFIHSTLADFFIDKLAP